MNTGELIEKIETALMEIGHEVFEVYGVNIESCDCDVSWEQCIDWNYAVSELARLMVEIAKQNR